MTVTNLTPRLKGLSVLLSASVPDPKRDERFRQIADAPFHIEQAVISLARAVFSEGGRLVFGGHPSISPLVATVAGEYRTPNFAEDSRERPRPSVSIYQCEAFREFIPRDTDLLIRLGLAEEHWVKAVADERFVPGKGSPHQQCPRSLEEMRTQMIKDSSPEAMVCIGGMEGVLLEVDIFRKFAKSRPIFALQRTGGAASLLTGDTIPIDIEVTKDATSYRDKATETRDRDIDVQPYPLIMQTIVDRIAPPSREK